MVNMKRLLISEETHRRLIYALADLEIHLIIDGESTDEVKQLLAAVKEAQDVEVGK